MADLRNIPHILCGSAGSRQILKHGAGWTTGRALKVKKLNLSEIVLPACPKLFQALQIGSEFITILFPGSGGFKEATGGGTPKIRGNVLKRIQ